MRERPASHAGTWYSKSSEELTAQLNKWLKNVTPIRGAKENENEPHDISGRFGVGPHAGYRFCGQVLAYLYANMNPEINRIILMGPSHKQFFRGVRVSKFHTLETPLSSLDVDRDVVKDMVSNGLVTYLDENIDISEHCLEMHYPFISLLFPHAKVVPLVFGAESDTNQYLEQYMAKFITPDSAQSTAFIVSSDFCHWGRHFCYQPFAGSDQIYQCIQDMDTKGMSVASGGSTDEWDNYIETTGNTICGQKPIRFLLSLSEVNNFDLHLEWLNYDQSSKVLYESESSVSYAAAIA